MQKGEFAQGWRGEVDPVGEELLTMYALRVDLKKLHMVVWYEHVCVLGVCMYVHMYGMHMHVYKHVHVCTVCIYI